MRRAIHLVVAGSAVVWSWGAAHLPAQQPAIQQPVPNMPAPNMPAGASPAWMQSASLQWLDNLDAAFPQAVAQRKFLLVHFWNDNCPPCIGVERNVFSRPEVQQAIGANFVAVKIKVDDHPELAQQYKVDRWPTDLILSPDGRELYRTVSSQNPNQYVAMLSRVASTARGAATAVQDASRTANQWADRVANTIPTFGNAPVEPAAANTPDAGAQASAANRFDPRAFIPPAPAAAPEGRLAAPNTPAPPPAPPSPPVPPSTQAPFASSAPNGVAPQARAAFQPNANPAPSAMPPVETSPSVDAPPKLSLGLDGFCPVTLHNTRKWRRGDARWGVVHRDRTYLFGGPDEQRAFLEDPDKFAPMLSGFDPVRYTEQGQLVEGRRQHGVWYRNQMFLFSDEASLERFWKNPNQIVPRVEQAMRATAQGGVVRR